MMVDSATTASHNDLCARIKDESNEICNVFCYALNNIGFVLNNKNPNRQIPWKKLFFQMPAPLSYMLSLRIDSNQTD
jgi:hypothetical protein